MLRTYPRLGLFEEYLLTVWITNLLALIKPLFNRHQNIQRQGNENGSSVSILNLTKKLFRNAIMNLASVRQRSYNISHLVRNLIKCS